MPRADRGAVWIVDLGMAAKIRPCLVLSVPTDPQDRMLVTLVPHPTSVQKWHAWIDHHRAELVATGLPAEVYLEEDHWSDFLENGHLHWHSTSGFAFGDLSLSQLTALHRLLEREFGATEQCPPLLRWVCVRAGLQTPSEPEA
jgi:hypothetical protein